LETTQNFPHGRCLISFYCFVSLLCVLSAVHAAVDLDDSLFEEYAQI
jgi:hypothetical protein